MKKHPTIAIIGLGYVGLPLAVAFATKYKVIGFDINSKRISELQEGEDVTLEISKDDLEKNLNAITKDLDSKSEKQVKRANELINAKINEVFIKY